MKKLVESNGYTTYLRLSNGLLLPLIIAGYAWLKADLAQTFVTKEELVARNKQQQLETQVMLAELTKNMSLLGQSVSSMEKILERKDNKL